MISRALVVFSGGQDSTICLYWAKKTFNEVHAVTFDYGQRHALEIEAATRIAAQAGVRSHEIVPVGPLLRSTSPLTDRGAALETYSDYQSMDKIIGERVELTFVPMRNAFFLTLAANLAVAKNCFDLVTGVCQQDNANYPDCRATFIDLQQQTINGALGINYMLIHTPLMDLDKAASIRLAQGLPGCMDALGHSHTCYAGKFPPCGECHSCVLRAEGFRQAGVPDPLLARAA
jgi:7-cyano-7-deazaguanine synthase